MTMHFKKDIDQALIEQLSVENSGIPQPDPLLVFEARQVVLRRKPRIYKLPSVVFAIFRHVSSALKHYQVGFSAAVMATAIFWISEMTPDYSGQTAYRDFSDTVYSMSEGAAPVTSSTMLATIPTLVIRN